MKQVILAGTVGKDAVLRRTQAGDPILGFSVAVDDGYGQNKSTMWFDASVFGKRGEALSKHITKGTKVTVSGELGTREHDGKTYLTVRVSEVELQGSKPDVSNRSSYDDPEPRRQSFMSDELSDDVPFAPEWR